MPGAFTVTPSELAAAGTAVGRDAGPLQSAAAAIRATTGAADGTPAAGAYGALLGDAATSLASIQTAVEGLGRGLSQAAANYEHAETTNRSEYQMGGAR